ncbi:MAG: hypothetical protein NTY79_01740 [Chloroflexi bacterium]|nr:hypothetical protein [Chloroflexota bacterium]
MADQAKGLDLAKLFQSVTGTLADNRQQLNEADTNNHDHGDNMVDTFEVITQAMREKKGADPADQLEYAAQMLRQRKSGSSQLYVKGLEQASQQYQGQQVTPANAMTLIQTLLGGGQAPQAQQQAGGLGGMLGSLLGGSGGQESQAQPQQQGGVIGNVLGSLLGGSGGQQGQQANDGFGLDDLLQAGMSFMSTKSKGGSNLEAIVNAVVSSSAMGGGYRQQSSNLVATALMQAVKGMIK